MKPLTISGILIAIAIMTSPQTQADSTTLSYNTIEASERAIIVDTVKPHESMWDEDLYIQ